MCEACEEFDVEVPVQGPDQLRRILGKVRSAVESGQLHYNSFESDRALIGQTSFVDLSVDGPLPDVLRYYFDCPVCESVYSLMVETYHGQGGKWCNCRKAAGP